MGVGWDCQTFFAGDTYHAVAILSRATVGNPIVSAIGHEYS